jgi:V8-like Glu-specific endopeptidase
VATHYLDQAPLDFSDPAVRELRSLLSGHYFRSGEVTALMREAGARPEYVNWDQPMVLAWDEVLDTLAKQGRLRPLLDNLIDGRDVALARRLRELVADSPVTEAPYSGVGTSRLLGTELDAELGGSEKITADESTLLDVSFLERGLEVASAVVRLTTWLDGRKTYGTGFRIGDDLLLSNHHVLFGRSGNPAARVEAWFGFEHSFDGGQREHVVVPCDVETIAGDPEHDWAVIRLAGQAPEGTAVIGLTGAPPVEVDDRVYIIQHPGGGPKQIGMVHNVVRHVDEDVLRYLTDTQGGSSGSPVFNERWQLVGVHHRWLTERESPRRWQVYNQGRRIERVAAGLAELGISHP